jgi:hypothetical protein
VSNIRLRIAYEDFPSTQRLVAMVQVGVRGCGWATLLAVEHGTAQHGVPVASPTLPRCCCHHHPHCMLSQDIYIARAEGELQLEEELFYLLLKIFKSPRLLNELTRLSQPQQQGSQLAS